MTHDVEKAELANRIAEAIGVKRPYDYHTRSQRRSIENGLVMRFENIKTNLSRFLDVTHASVEDIIATQIAYQISVGETPIVDIPSIKVELANLEKKYKIKQDTPTSGRRGSQGQKTKQLVLIAEKIKPLNTVLNNYHKGKSLFYFESTKKPSSVFTEQIEDSTDSGFIDSLSIIPQAYAQETIPQATRLRMVNVTNNSVSLNWDHDDTATGYHIVIKDEDTGQTIHALDLPNTDSTIISNLKEATNYKAYIIVVNAVGNSPETSISFKTTGIKVTISSDVQAILTKLENNDYTYPEWFSNNIKWVKDGSITNSEFLVAFNNLLQTGTIIDKSAHGPEDTTIDLNMVSQSIGAFKLENNRVKGSIIYIAESSFNPYYYNKPLTSIVSIKDQSGRTVKLKTNNLNFTATERDETINIDEEVGELDGVKIEFLVWKSVDDPIAFSKKKVDEVVAEEVGLAPCPLGQHRNFSGKCVPDDPIIGTSLLGKVMGVTAILGTLALLGSKGR